MTGLHHAHVARARADYCGSNTASYVRAVSNLRTIRRASPLFEYVSSKPLLGTRSPLR